ncbi:hypothetical protein GF389_01180 [Candidatus Dojkabacteria bacterium]|nr:hypothetical protein [Candidatus Dojkabacteria bacterium]
MITPISPETIGDWEHNLTPQQFQMMGLISRGVEFSEIPIEPTNLVALGSYYGQLSLLADTTFQYVGLANRDIPNFDNYPLAQYSEQLNATTRSIRTNPLLDQDTIRHYMGDRAVFSQKPNDSYHTEPTHDFIRAALESYVELCSGALLEVYRGDETLPPELKIALEALNTYHLLGRGIETGVLDGAEYIGSITSTHDEVGVIGGNSLESDNQGSAAWLIDHNYEFKHLNRNPKMRAAYEFYSAVNGFTRKTTRSESYRDTNKQTAYLFEHLAESIYIHEELSKNSGGFERKEGQFLRGISAVLRLSSREGFPESLTREFLEYYNNPFLLTETIVEGISFDRWHRQDLERRYGEITASMEDIDTLIDENALPSLLNSDDHCTSYIEGDRLNQLETADFNQWKTNSGYENDELSPDSYAAREDELRKVYIEERQGQWERERNGVKKQKIRGWMDAFQGMESPESYLEARIFLDQIVNTLSSNITSSVTGSIPGNSRYVDMQLALRALDSALFHGEMSYEAELDLFREFTNLVDKGLSPAIAATNLYAEIEQPYWNTASDDSTLWRNFHDNLELLVLLMDN